MDEDQQPTPDYAEMARERDRRLRAEFDEIERHDLGLGDSEEDKKVHKLHKKGCGCMPISILGGAAILFLLALLGFGVWVAAVLDDDEGGAQEAAQVNATGVTVDAPAAVTPTTAAPTTAAPTTAAPPKVSPPPTSPPSAAPSPAPSTQASPPPTPRSTVAPTTVAVSAEAVLEEMIAASTDGILEKEQQACYRTALLSILTPQELALFADHSGPVGPDSLQAVLAQTSVSVGQQRDRVVECAS